MIWSFFAHFIVTIFHIVIIFVAEEFIMEFALLKPKTQTTHFDVDTNHHQLPWSDILVASNSKRTLHFRKRTQHTAYNTICACSMFFCRQTLISDPKNQRVSDIQRHAHPKIFPYYLHSECDIYIVKLHECTINLCGTEETVEHYRRIRTTSGFRLDDCYDLSLDLQELFHDSC